MAAASRVNTAENLQSLRVKQERPEKLGGGGGGGMVTRYENKRDIYVYILLGRSSTEAEFTNVLGIILRVLRLGYGFLSGFPSFSFTETVRGCVSLKK